jgi:8-hydroxy-5-deazaflavin:NADPH oxidoreductase
VAQAIFDEQSCISVSFSSPSEYSIGILGAGAFGRALALRAARNGIEVALGSRRPPTAFGDRFAAIANKVRIVNPVAACQPEIVVLAVPWLAVATATAPVLDWESRIVIDATNANRVLDRSSSALLAERLPGAYVVKALNTLSPEQLVAVEPSGWRRVVFFSGNDARAKQETGRLLSRLGVAGIDLGDLETGGRLYEKPAGPLASKHLVEFDSAHACVGDRG